MAILNKFLNIDSEPGAILGAGYREVQITKSLASKSLQSSRLKKKKKKELLIVIMQCDWSIRGVHRVTQSHGKAPRLTGRWSWRGAWIDGEEDHGKLLEEVLPQLRTAV